MAFSPFFRSLISLTKNNSSILIRQESEWLKFPESELQSAIFLTDSAALIATAHCFLPTYTLWLWPCLKWYMSSKIFQKSSECILIHFFSRRGTPVENHWNKPTSTINWLRKLRKYLKLSSSLWIRTQKLSFPWIFRLQISNSKSQPGVTRHIVVPWHNGWEPLNKTNI